MDSLSFWGNVPAAARREYDNEDRLPRSEEDATTARKAGACRLRHMNVPVTRNVQRGAAHFGVSLSSLLPPSCVVAAPSHARLSQHPHVLWIPGSRYHRDDTARDRVRYVADSRATLGAHLSAAAPCDARCSRVATRKDASNHRLPSLHSADWGVMVGSIGEHASYCRSVCSLFVCTAGRRRRVLRAFGGPVQ